MSTEPAAHTLTDAPDAAADVEFAHLLTLVERAVSARMSDVLKANGATLEEWRVLCLLGDEGGRAMTEIAEYALLAAPTLTKVVDRMVSANLVLRRPDDADRRRVLVFATDRGRQALAGWSELIQAQRNALVAALGSEEVALLRMLLVRAAGRLGLSVPTDPGIPPRATTSPAQ